MGDSLRGGWEGRQEEVSEEVEGSRRCGGVIRIRLPAEPRKAQK